jgi:CHASE3 domain sensor protein
MSVLARTIGGFATVFVFPLVVVGIVVWGLLKSAGATARKTTTMPRDKRRR